VAHPCQRQQPGLQPQADQQPPTTTLQLNLRQDLDLHLSRMPIASMLDPTPKTRTLGPMFPRTSLTGVRVQLKGINLQLLNSSKEHTRNTDAVLLVLDLDLLLSQKQQVLQQRRTIPPLDLLLRPDLFPKGTGALVTIMRRLARADARSIATANSAQSRRTSAGDIKKDILAVNSSSASAERMEKRTDQLYYQDANAIAKEDAQSRLCCFFKL